MSRLFVRLIFSGSRFNFIITSDPFYCLIIIVTEASCTSLDHFYFYECLGVGVPYTDDKCSRSGRTRVV